MEFIGLTEVSHRIKEMLNCQVVGKIRNQGSKDSKTAGTYGLLALFDPNLMVVGR
jgi:hypothetical protein